jgi:hypothetical protein
MTLIIVCMAAGTHQMASCSDARLPGRHRSMRNGRGGPGGRVGRGVGEGLGVGLVGLGVGLGIGVGEADGDVEVGGSAVWEAKAGSALAEVRVSGPVPGDAHTVGPADAGSDGHGPGAALAATMCASRSKNDEPPPPSVARVEWSTTTTRLVMRSDPIVAVTAEPRDR